MQTDRYHRDQAALCLQIASLLSDPVAARLMRTAAARHFEQVAKLEALSTAPSGNLRGDDNGRDDFSDSFYYRAIRTRIGEALRSQLLPTEPAPERFLKLLRALDQPKGGHNSGLEGKQGDSKDAPAAPEEKSARLERTE
jgi:hypothetical protein